MLLSLRFAMLLLPLALSVKLLKQLSLGGVDLLIQSNIEHLLLAVQSRQLSGLKERFQGKSSFTWRLHIISIP